MVALLVSRSGTQSYARAAAWLALAAAGQAATFGMIDAGTSVHYQHYETMRALAASRPWLLAFVAFQTLAVAVALVSYWRARPLNAPRLPVVRIVLALLIATCTAATVSPDPWRYAGELTFAAFLQLLAMTNMVLCVLAVPAASVDRIAERVNQWLGPATDEVTPSKTPDRFACTAALAATVLAAVLCVLSYERHPHLPDEVVYQHHARYFAEGKLTMQGAPPVPAAFDVDLFEYEPARWFSPVPPGWPAVLAAGALVGAPWLVNPILAGINVLLAALVLGHLYPRRVVRTAVALLAASPWFLFLGMSLMTHQFTLTSVLIAALGVVAARRSGGIGWGLVAGAGVGLTSLIRPLDGVVVGLLIGAWSIGIGGTRLRFASLAGLAIGTIAIGALAFTYNQAITGKPLTFPINAYVDKHYKPGANDYGFGPQRGMGWAFDPYPGHGPLDGLINTNLNVFGLNTDLLGWGTGSLILIAWLLCSGALQRRDWLMIAPALMFPAAYFAYYFSGGPDFGARYWFPIIVPLIALTARGLDAAARSAGPRVWIAAASLSVLALVLFVPWRAADKYYHFRGMRADVRTIAAVHGFGDDLVLVRGKRFPDYASAFVENPIDLRGPGTIYAWDRDADTRAAVLRAYADRRVWILDGPTLTGGGFRVSAGPLPAAALLSGGAGK